MLSWCCGMVESLVIGSGSFNLLSSSPYRFLMLQSVLGLQITRLTVLSHY